MSRIHRFEHRSIIPTTMARILAFHEQPSALAKLTPPPIFAQLRRDSRTSLTNGELEFTLWFLFFPVRWTARHEPGPTPTSFADVQVKGPLKSWRHEHIFIEVPGGVELRDQITFEHRERGLWPLFTRVNFSKPLLWVLFTYRHLRTRLGTRGRTS